MKHRIVPAILSGGAGTRLWPVSTDAAPKQFHAIAGTRSLFAETVRRVSGEADALSFAPPIVLANAAHSQLLTAQLGGSPTTAIVFEQTGRNTAAAAVVAAAIAAEADPQALVLLLPADHLITDRAAFLAAITRAAPFARERIVTFGMAPDRPATGYGYIKSGEPLGDGVLAIAAFHEKPEIEKARDYLAAGGYFWNSGMFLFHPQTMLEEFVASAEIRDGALAALRAASRAGTEIFLDAAAFAATPSLPLDVAVMEKTTRGAVAPCAFGWADVGAWDEVWRLSYKDDQGNARHGAVVAIDAANNLIRAEGMKVCVAGVSDLIVIATREAVIVLPRRRAQELRELHELAVKLP